MQNMNNEKMNHTGHNHKHIAAQVNTNKPSDGHDHHSMMIVDLRTRFLVCMVITIPILILSPMIQMLIGVNLRFQGDSYLLAAISTALFLYGGIPFMKGAINELKKKTPGMMTLITLAIVVAYTYSILTIFAIRGGDFFWELATLIDIMLLGHWIEMKSTKGASKAIVALLKLMPESTHMIIPGGEILEKPIKELKTGDAILVKPGENIPIDGVVYEGTSTVDESMITGESLPVEKQPGSEIIGGSLNGEGILKIKVSKTGEDTFISQVIKLVREAEESKSRTQQLADRAAGWLFYIAVVLGLATFVIWTATGSGISFAIERAVTVIVICCPHALGLAAPLVNAVSTDIGARKGLSIRNRANFENARKLDTVLFDKTGTLTEGQFGITDIHETTVSKQELLEISYSMELQSEHPIAKAIVEEGKKMGLTAREVRNYRNITGVGLQGQIEDREFLIVGPSYLRAQNIRFDEGNYDRLAADGKTIIFVLQDGGMIGSIALTDKIKESAVEAISALKEMGIESYMLTGDNRRVASDVASKLHINKVIAEILPEEKARIVEEVKQGGKMVAMTGDGVNDAPALARADLGIAIGAGTDVAIETADIVLVRSNPLDVVNIIKLSKATYRKMIQNLFWAIGYNIVALPLAAGILYSQGILISPAIGALFMSLSTIIVAVNARCLKID